MKYQTTIIAKVKHDVFESIKPELEQMGRSQVSLTKHPDHLKFQVNADDSVALRAALNGITKLLTAYEKIDDIK